MQNEKGFRNDERYEKLLQMFLQKKKNEEKKYISAEQVFRWKKWS